VNTKLCINLTEAGYRSARVVQIGCNFPIESCSELSHGPLELLRRGFNIDALPVLGPASGSWIPRFSGDNHSGLAGDLQSQHAETRLALTVGKLGRKFGSVQRVNDSKERSPGGSHLAPERWHPFQVIPFLLTLEGDVR